MEELKKSKLILVLVLMLIAIGCNKDDNSEGNGISSISVKLMDDPANFDNVQEESMCYWLMIFKYHQVN